MGLSEAAARLVELIEPGNTELVTAWGDALGSAGGIYQAMNDEARRTVAAGTITVFGPWIRGMRATDDAIRRFVESPPYRSQPLDEFVLATMCVGRAVRNHLEAAAESPEALAEAMAVVDSVLAEGMSRVVRMRSERGSPAALLTDIGQRLSYGTDDRRAMREAMGVLAEELGANLCVTLATRLHDVEIYCASETRDGIRAGDTYPHDELDWLALPRGAAEHAIPVDGAGLERVLFAAGVKHVQLRTLAAQGRNVGVLMVGQPDRRELSPTQDERLACVLPLLGAHLAYAREHVTLRETTAALDDLFDASPGMLCALDRLGRVLRTNGRFRTEIGVPEDVVGMPLSWLVHPTWVDTFAELWARLQRGEDVERARLDLVSADVRQLPLAIEAHWVEHQPVCMVAFWDVSDALARQAKDRQRINELTDFAHHIAHDLKAPLRSIAGFTGLLVADLPPDLPEESADAVDRIQNAVSRANRMIDGLLRFARGTTLQGGHSEITLETLLTDVRAQLAVDLVERGARLEVVADETPLLGDSVALGTLLANLVGNAVRYTPGDAPRVELALRDDGPGWALLTVRDEGLGIAPEDHEEVFQLFTRRSNDDQGSGVGLTIVQRIAAAHGGHVRLDSELGVGSTFTVRLPSP